ncbi:NAD(P)H-flavin reductase [Marinomonas transparens]|uniref:NAD(P)H-flavin reductase n=1 Tax=Marinomonas transparens TaxID=2795388 RepID=A0A934JSV2_9GAMM|nr:NAD(P)H-flavin reductase [Marinomonas transparens]MBJ7539283.1 NAD(P)H-flavin reductase [Marinomonas transparens]
MKDLTAKVNSVQLINHNVYKITLHVENTSFVAGQYLMILLPTGEQVPYSIGSAPHELPSLTLYILVNDETSLAYRVVEYIRINEIINIKAPGGDCHVQNGMLESMPDQILLIAGGTGFSQVKSLYDDLAAQDFSGQVSLYWGLRTPEDIFELDWINTAQTNAHFSIDVIVNEADNSWKGRTGWLYEAVLKDHPNLNKSIAFISGSVGMVYGTLDQLELKGLNKDKCFSDVFAYAPHPEKPEL